MTKSVIMSSSGDPTVLTSDEVVSSNIATATVSGTSKEENVELMNIHEDGEEEVDVNGYDSDGVARERSPSGRSSSCTGSVGSSGSGSGSGAGKAKRRSWKKPKDKPKRPLSAYNIFFKHERSRIVSGQIEEATPDEIIRSIKHILSTTRETRRHRKTHGRISFGDLARKIADQWKAIAADQKALFEHFAELDMRRYRREVQLWKDRKEHEAFGGKGGGSPGLDGSTSNPSFSDSVSEYSEPGMDHQHQQSAPYGLTMSASSTDAWAPRRSFHDSFNSSCSSVASDFRPDPVHMNLQFLQLQQHQQQQRKQSQFADCSPNFHASMPNLGFGSGGAGAGFNGTILPSMVQSGGEGMGGMRGFATNGGYQFEQELPPCDGLGERSISNMEMFMGLQQQQQLQVRQQRRQQQQGMLLGQQMNSLHHSFCGGNRMRNERMKQQVQQQQQSPYLNSVPLFVGSDPAASANFQPSSETSDEFDSPVPADCAKFGFHSISSPNSNGLDPVPFDEVFTDTFGGGEGKDGGKDIEHSLLTLDLSNMM